MAPPTPFTTKYDADIKQHVLEVPDKITGEIKKFVYNENFNYFEGAPEPTVVYERDLEPVYSTQCSRHTRIVFCRNKWSNGKVYKYVQGDERVQWYKVQCMCCQFVENSVPDQEDVKKIKESMRPDRVVDYSPNYLWIKPVCSKFCEATQKITVFCKNYNGNQSFALNFDLKTNNFVESECSSACCMEIPEWNQYAPQPFDFGSQGLYYTRNHRDRAGRPLICLAINWYNTEHGKMEIFIDTDGDVGKYTWNEKYHCFDLVQTLDVKTMNYKLPAEIPKKTELCFDDELRLMYTQDCPTLMEKIFFCNHMSDGKMRKYIFNSTSLQFVVVQCPCCVFDFVKKEIRFVASNFTNYISNTTGTDVVIRRNNNYTIVKEVYSVNGEKRMMKRSPIRIDSHFQPNEFLTRREIESQRTMMTQVYIENHSEGWVIRRCRIASDGVTSVGTVAMMDGTIKPFYFSMNDNMYRFYETDCVDLTKSRDEISSSQKLNEARYPLNWDLSPKYIYRCKHSGNHLISAYNHFTNSTGTYTYSSETGHCHENKGCIECQETFHLAGPDQVLMGVQSPYSRRAVILKTNSEGRLMKVGHNPNSEAYCGMAPLRILKETDRVGEQESQRIVSQEHHFKAVHDREEMIKYREKVSKLEEELEREKKEKVTLSTEIESLEKKWKDLEKALKQMEGVVNIMTEEKEAKKKEEQEQKRVQEEKKKGLFDVDALEKMSTDFDLIPKFRNYCTHTGHFLLTAYNVISEKTGHYVFNPTTGTFHRQEYCPKCPTHENGVKIQNFVTIMPVKTQKSKFPYLIMTNHHGRLVKIAFDSNIKGFISLEPTTIEKQVNHISEIPNSIGSCQEIAMPIALNGPFDVDLVPKFRVYCTHVGEFLINAFNSAIGEQGFYMFNSTTGHLEQREGCPSCQETSPLYHIEPLRSIMPVMTPYSKWPLMLTTDKDGKFLPIAFKPNSLKFENMKALAIKMFVKKPESVSVLKIASPSYISEICKNVVPTQANQEEIDRIVEILNTIPKERVQINDSYEDKVEEKEEQTADSIIEQLSEASATIEDVPAVEEEYSQYSDKEESEDDEEDEVTEEKKTSESPEVEESEGSDDDDDEYYCNCSGSECECPTEDEDEEDEEESEDDEDDEDEEMKRKKALGPVTMISEVAGSDESEGEDDDDDEYCNCSGSECECSDCSDEECSDEEEDEEEEEEDKEEKEEEVTKETPEKVDPAVVIHQRNVEMLMRSLFAFDAIDPTTGERAERSLVEEKVEEHGVQENCDHTNCTQRQIVAEEDIEQAMDKLDINMTQSTTTAIEGDLEEYQELLKSTATAIAPEEERTVFDDTDLDEEFMGCKKEKNEEVPGGVNLRDLGYRFSAVEDSSDSDYEHVENEMISSTMTAVEPEEDENVSAEMISSTATAIEPEDVEEQKVDRDDASSLASDISYLDSDLGTVEDSEDSSSEMVKSTYEDCEESEQSVEPVEEDDEEKDDTQETTPLNPAPTEETCIIS